MKILFFCHYFPPETNAPAARTYDHCVRWVKAGHDVTVVTCAPNCPDGVVYPGYKNRLRSQRETIDGIEVVRVWTYVAPNAGTLKRIVNFVSYMLSAVWTAFWMRKPDVIIATSPQFFCGWAGVVLRFFKRAPFVLEIRDIWPETISTVGAIKSRFLLRILERLEKWMYRGADHVVAVGNGYKENILSKVPLDDRISVITNGVDLDQFQIREPDEEWLAQWNLSEKFVCAYVGTIGMCHGLEVVAKAAALLKAKGRNDIAFCLVGDGAARPAIEQTVRDENLGNWVVFTGRLPKEDMPKVLSSSDICLVHLRGCELFSTVIPSKIFETLAMGRPIIMGVRGEACDMVMESGAGFKMEPDSAESLVEILEHAADHRDELAERSATGRTYVAEHFNRDILADRFLTLLKEMTGK